ncbi:hypothetical protein scyTo_0023900, partial [Scyliorhinus torazame]|nr:hypothetical protein [Scyliorhinus torazame]
EGLHIAATTTSIDLEKAYLADNSGKMEFTAGKHQYVLDFKEMSQRNTRIGTQRDVRRRPKFVSEQDVEDQIQKYVTACCGLAKEPSEYSRCHLSDMYRQGMSYLSFS